MSASEVTWADEAAICWGCRRPFRISEEAIALQQHEVLDRLEPREIPVHAIHLRLVQRSHTGRSEQRIPRLDRPPT